MALRCPLCREPLIETRGDSVSLEGCARCGGVWLRREAVGAARHVSPAALAALDAQLGWSSGPAPAGKGSGGPCPGCGQAMEQRPDSLHPSLRIDVCRACAGVWLDPGELGRFRITGADRAAAAGAAGGSASAEERLLGLAWCLDIVGALLDIATDR